MSLHFPPSEFAQRLERLQAAMQQTASTPCSSSPRRACIGSPAMTASASASSNAWS